MPSLTPSMRSFRLVALERGSSAEAEISPMKTLVGSDLHPAPIDEITRIEFEWQYRSKATLESMLSIASIT